MENNNILPQEEKLLQYDELKITPKDVIHFQKLLMKYTNKDNLNSFLAEDAVSEFLIEIMINSNATFNQKPVSKYLFENDMEAAKAFIKMNLEIIEELNLLMTKKKK